MSSKRRSPPVEALEFQWNRQSFGGIVKPVAAYWSWILTVVSLAGLWTTGNRKRWGWLLSLGSEGLWIAYAILYHQYGFIVMSVIFSVIYIRNWRKWGKTDDERTSG